MRDWQSRSGPSASGHVRPATRAAGAGARREDLVGRARRDPGQLAELGQVAGNEAATSIVARDVQRAPEPGAAPAPAEAQAGRDADPQTGEVDDAANAERDDDRTLELAEAVCLGSMGSVAYHAFPADIEGEAVFIAFDNPTVNRAFRILLRSWGLEGDTTENGTSDGTPPGWVGEFRSRALNLRPQVEAERPIEGSMARIAGVLADSVAAETTAERIRRQAVEEIQGSVGTTVMTQDAIDAVRGGVAKDGLTPANFTTCIAFFGQVMTGVMSRSGLTAPIIKGPNWYTEINPTSGKESLGDRWVPYSHGARPKPGDLLIFTFNEEVKNDTGGTKYGVGWFAHISILRAVEPARDETDPRAERWISVDGGGTTAQEVTRIFHPDTDLIVGPGTVTRTMKGWIDLEAAVEKGLVPKPGEAVPAR